MVQNLLRDPLIPLYIHQANWVMDTSRFKIGMWARQTGKSFACTLEAALDCQEKKTDWVFLSAGERQSKELIRKAKTHVEACSAAYEMIDTFFTGDSGVTYKQLEILWDNGSRIIALPANPDTSRGHSANLVLDEFAFHKDSRQIWRAIFPTITRGYKLRIVSTPQGKGNKFYELWSGNPKYSKHFVDIWTAWKGGMPIFGDDGDPVDPDYLKEALDDDDAWSQEYLCEFLDEAHAWITYELIAMAEDQQLTFDNEWRGGRVYAGVDIGRKKDLTVYWSIERTGDMRWTKRISVFEKMMFSDQRANIEALIALDGPDRVCVDSTGHGSQLAEELQTKFGERRVELVHFRNTVKEDLAVTLKQLFQDQTVRIPVDQKVREDIHAVKKYVTTAGNVRFDAERTKDGHADRFWALALAAHAASQATGEVVVTVGKPRESIIVVRGY